MSNLILIRIKFKENDGLTGCHVKYKAEKRAELSFHPFHILLSL